jgi:hypothetical protein
MVFPHFTLPLLQALPPEGFAMPHHVIHRARILQSKTVQPWAGLPNPFRIARQVVLLYFRLRASDFTFRGSRRALRLAQGLTPRVRGLAITLERLRKVVLLAGRELLHTST